MRLLATLLPRCKVKQLNTKICTGLFACQDVRETAAKARSSTTATTTMTSNKAACQAARVKVQSRDGGQFGDKHKKKRGRHNTGVRQTRSMALRPTHAAHTGRQQPSTTQRHRLRLHLRLAPWAQASCRAPSGPPLLLQHVGWGTARHLPP